MSFSKYNRNEENMRNSGIELLKIIAILLIIISHVVQTLRSFKPSYIPYSDYLIDLSVSTENFQYFILMLLSYFGVLGNTIFFISSAWFLLHSKRINMKKWFFILVEVWSISIIILIISSFIMNDEISRDLVIKSILPTLYGNNWYMTCYLLFYPMHVFLNNIIKKMDKKTLFRCSAMLFVIYCGINFLKEDWLYFSRMFLWITLYFSISFIQLYVKESNENKKYNRILLLIGLTGYIGSVALANILGLHFDFFNGKTLRWVKNSNPFIIAISFALFNMIRTLKIKNKTINYIASLSMLIYLIHENIILRTYVRPAIWQYIYLNYGYSIILLWVLVLTVAIFVLSFMASMLYDKTIRKTIKNISDKMFLVIKSVYLRVETRILSVENSSEY